MSDSDVIGVDERYNVVHVRYPFWNYRRSLTETSFPAYNISILRATLNESGTIPLQLIGRQLSEVLARSVIVLLNCGWYQDVSFFEMRDFNYIVFSRTSMWWDIGNRIVWYTIINCITISKRIIYELYMQQIMRANWLRSQLNVVRTFIK